MDPKKLSLRLKPRGKTTGRESAEDRQLAPMMRALKAIHSVGTPDSMNPEDLAKQRAAQEVLGRLVAPMIVMKKWETFHLKEMACAWVKPDWPHDKRRVTSTVTAGDIPVETWATPAHWHQNSPMPLVGRPCALSIVWRRNTPSQRQWTMLDGRGTI